MAEPIAAPPSTGVLRELSIPAPEAQGLGSILAQSFLDGTYTSSLRITSIHKINNNALERQYIQKRSEMQAVGRTPNEMQEKYGFTVARKSMSYLKKIVNEGLVTQRTDYNAFGDSSKGIYISKHCDVMLKFAESHNTRFLRIIVHKLTPGRLLATNHGPEIIQPTPNFDGHISATLPTISASLEMQVMLSQMYVYEFDDNGEPAPHPRHTCPYAVFSFERNEVSIPPIPSQPQQQGQEQQQQSQQQQQQPQTVPTTSAAAATHLSVGATPTTTPSVPTSVIIAPSVSSVTPSPVPNQQTVHSITSTARGQHSMPQVVSGPRIRELTSVTSPQVSVNSSTTPAPSSIPLQLAADSITGLNDRSIISSSKVTTQQGTQVLQLVKTDQAGFRQLIAKQQALPPGQRSLILPLSLAPNSSTLQRAPQTVQQLTPRSTSTSTAVRRGQSRACGQLSSTRQVRRSQTVQAPRAPQLIRAPRLIAPSILNPPVTSMPSSQQLLQATVVRASTTTADFTVGAVTLPSPSVNQLGNTQQPTSIQTFHTPTVGDPDFGSVTPIEIAPIEGYGELPYTEEPDVAELITTSVPVAVPVTVPSSQSVSLVSTAVIPTATEGDSSSAHLVVKQEPKKKSGSSRQWSSSIIELPSSDEELETFSNNANQTNCQRETDSPQKRLGQPCAQQTQDSPTSNNELRPAQSSLSGTPCETIVAAKETRMVSQETADLDVAAVTSEERTTETNTCLGDSSAKKVLHEYVRTREDGSIEVVQEMVLESELKRRQAEASRLSSGHRWDDSSDEDDVDLEMDSEQALIPSKLQNGKPPQTDIGHSTEKEPSTTKVYLTPATQDSEALSCNMVEESCGSEEQKTTSESTDKTSELNLVISSVTSVASMACHSDAGKARTNHIVVKSEEAPKRKSPEAIEISGSFMSSPSILTEVPDFDVSSFPVVSENIPEKNTRLDTPLTGTESDVSSVVAKPLQKAIGSLTIAKVHERKGRGDLHHKKKTKHPHKHHHYNKAHKQKHGEIRMVNSDKIIGRITQTDSSSSNQSNDSYRVHVSDPDGACISTTVDTDNDSIASLSVRTPCRTYGPVEWKLAESDPKYQPYVRLTDVTGEFDHEPPRSPVHIGDSEYTPPQPKLTYKSKQKTPAFKLARTIPTWSPAKRRLLTARKSTSKGSLKPKAVALSHPRFASNALSRSLSFTTTTCLGSVDSLCGPLSAGTFTGSPQKATDVPDQEELTSTLESGPNTREGNLPKKSVADNKSHNGSEQSLGQQEEGQSIMDEDHRNDANKETEPGYIPVKATKGKPKRRRSTGKAKGKTKAKAADHSSGSEGSAAKKKKKEVEKIMPVRRGRSLKALLQPEEQAITESLKSAGLITIENEFQVINQIAAEEAIAEKTGKDISIVRKKPIAVLSSKPPRPVKEKGKQKKNKNDQVEPFFDPKIPLVRDDPDYVERTMHIPEIPGILDAPGAKSAAGAAEEESKSVAKSTGEEKDGSKKDSEQKKVETDPEKLVMDNNEFIKILQIRLSMTNSAEEAESIKQTISVLCPPTAMSKSKTPRDKSSKPGVKINMDEFDYEEDDQGKAEPSQNEKESTPVEESPQVEEPEEEQVITLGAEFQHDVSDEALGGLQDERWKILNALENLEEEGDEDALSSAQGEDQTTETDLITEADQPTEIVKAFKLDVEQPTEEAQAKETDNTQETNNVHTDEEVQAGEKLKQGKQKRHKQNRRKKRTSVENDGEAEQPQKHVVEKEDGPAVAAELDGRSSTHSHDSKNSHSLESDDKGAALGSKKLQKKKLYTDSEVIRNMMNPKSPNKTGVKANLFDGYGGQSTESHNTSSDPEEWMQILQNINKTVPTTEAGNVLEKIRASTAEQPPKEQKAEESDSGKKSEEAKSSTRESDNSEKTRPSIASTSKEKDRNKTPENVKLKSKINLKDYLARNADKKTPPLQVKAPTVPIVESAQAASTKCEENSTESVDQSIKNDFINPTELENRLLKGHENSAVKDLGYQDILKILETVKQNEENLKRANQHSKGSPHAQAKPGLLPTPPRQQQPPGHHQPGNHLPGQHHSRHGRPPGDPPWRRRPDHQPPGGSPPGHNRQGQRLSTQHELERRTSVEQRPPIKQQTLVIERKSSSDSATSMSVEEKLDCLHQNLEINKAKQHELSEELSVLRARLNSPGGRHPRLPQEIQILDHFMRGLHIDEEIIRREIDIISDETKGRINRAVPDDVLLPEELIKMKCGDIPLVLMTKLDSKKYGELLSLKCDHIACWDEWKRTSPLDQQKRASLSENFTIIKQQRVRLLTLLCRPPNYKQEVKELQRKLRKYCQHHAEFQREHERDNTACTKARLKHINSRINELRAHITRFQGLPHELDGNYGEVRPQPVPVPNTVEKTPPEASRQAKPTAERDPSPSTSTGQPTPSGSSHCAPSKSSHPSASGPNCRSPTAPSHPSPSGSTHCSPSGSACHSPSRSTYQSPSRSPVFLPSEGTPPWQRKKERESRPRERENRQIDKDDGRQVREDHILDREDLRLDREGRRFLNRDNQQLERDARRQNRDEGRPDSDAHRMDQDDHIQSVPAEGTKEALQDARQNVEQVSELILEEVTAMLPKNISEILPQISCGDIDLRTFDDLPPWLIKSKVKEDTQQNTQLISSPKDTGVQPEGPHNRSSHNRKSRFETASTVVPNTQRFLQRDPRRRSSVDSNGSSGERHCESGSEKQEGKTRDPRRQSSTDSNGSSGSTRRISGMEGQGQSYKHSLSSLRDLQGRDSVDSTMSTESSKTKELMTPSTACQNVSASRDPRRRGSVDSNASFGEPQRSTEADIVSRDPCGRPESGTSQHAVPPPEYDSGDENWNVRLATCIPNKTQENLGRSVEAPAEYDSGDENWNRRVVLPENIQEKSGLKITISPSGKSEVKLSSVGCPSVTKETDLRHSLLEKIHAEAKTSSSSIENIQPSETQKYEFLIGKSEVDIPGFEKCDDTLKESTECQLDQSFADSECGDLMIAGDIPETLVKKSEQQSAPRIEESVASAEPAPPKEVDSEHSTSSKDDTLNPNTQKEPEPVQNAGLLKSDLHTKQLPKPTIPSLESNIEPATTTGDIPVEPSDSLSSLPSDSPENIKTIQEFSVSTMDSPSKAEQTLSYQISRRPSYASSDDDVMYIKTTRDNILKQVLQKKKQMEEALLTMKEEPVDLGDSLEEGNPDKEVLKESREQDTSESPQTLASAGQTENCNIKQTESTEVVEKEVIEVSESLSDIIEIRDTNDSNPGEAEPKPNSVHENVAQTGESEVSECTSGDVVKEDKPKKSTSPSTRVAECKDISPSKQHSQDGVDLREKGPTLEKEKSAKVKPSRSAQMCPAKDGNNARCLSTAKKVGSHTLKPAKSNVPGKGPKFHSKEPQKSKSQSKPASSSAKRVTQSCKSESKILVDKEGDTSSSVKITSIGTPPVTDSKSLTSQNRNSENKANSLDYSSVSVPQAQTLTSDNVPKSVEDQVVALLAWGKNEASATNIRQEKQQEDGSSKEQSPSVSSTNSERSGRGPSTEGDISKLSSDYHRMNSKDRRKTFREKGRKSTTDSQKDASDGNAWHSFAQRYKKRPYEAERSSSSKKKEEPPTDAVRHSRERTISLRQSISPTPDARGQKRKLTDIGKQSSKNARKQILSSPHDDYDPSTGTWTKYNSNDDLSDSLSQSSSKSRELSPEKRSRERFGRERSPKRGIHTLGRRGFRRDGQRARLRSRSRSRSPALRRRRSRSPVVRRSHSPSPLLRRSRSRSPRYRRSRSRSPPLRRYWPRSRSPSPGYRRRRSPSPYRSYRSRSRSPQLHRALRRTPSRSPERFKRRGTRLSPPRSPDLLLSPGVPEKHTEHTESPDLWNMALEDTNYRNKNRDIDFLPQTADPREQELKLQSSAMHSRADRHYTAPSTGHSTQYHNVHESAYHQSATTGHRPPPHTGVPAYHGHHHYQHTHHHHQPHQQQSVQYSTAPYAHSFWKDH